MRGFLVTDVGNSRIKCGWCDEQRVEDSVSLPLNDSAAWLSECAARWPIASSNCLLAGVNPIAMERFAAWLGEQGCSTTTVRDYRQIPLQIVVERPEQVGLDRLLNAVAFNSIVPRRQPGVIAGVGTAVTVDWVDEQGVFRGGAIFPGLRLMTQALNAYTAQLPLVEVRSAPPRHPGENTTAAIALGVFNAVAGGIRATALSYMLQTATAARQYLTGGDGALLTESLGEQWSLWPLMTLEGLRLVAQHLR